MTSPILQGQSASYIKSRPEIRQGYTVRVHEKIQEGGKERVQVLEGLVIAVHKGLAPTDSTFTVRRIASGIGVERVFSLHSPTIVKIEVKKVAKVRRAKLFFLRGRRGKAARLSERFTTAEEFAIAVQSEDQGEDKKEEQEVLEEKPGESNDESEDNAGLEEKTSTKEQSSPAADPKPEKSQQENDSNEEDEKSHEEDEKKEA